jgi:hypothetical protein
MRKLGARLVHVADFDMATPPRLSTGMLSPEASGTYQKPLSDSEIAVVGMSCKVAGADDLEEFWKLLCKGKSQHVEVLATVLALRQHGVTTTRRENGLGTLSEITMPLTINFGGRAHENRLP